MYKALKSFTTNNYDIRLNQILEDDFTTQDEINEYLSIGYIRTYDPSEEGIMSESVSDIWTGTQAEYDSITSPVSTTLYFIKEA